jgi:hypothetical protein
MRFSGSIQFVRLIPADARHALLVRTAALVVLSFASVIVALAIVVSIIVMPA